MLDDVKDASLRSRRNRRAAPVLDLVCARRGNAIATGCRAPVAGRPAEIPAARRREVIAAAANADCRSVVTNACSLPPVRRTSADATRASPSAIPRRLACASCHARMLAPGRTAPRCAASGATPASDVRGPSATSESRPGVRARSPIWGSEADEPRTHGWCPRSRARSTSADGCNFGWCSSPREVVTTYAAINKVCAGGGQAMPPRPGGCGPRLTRCDGRRGPRSAMVARGRGLARTSRGDPIGA